MKRLVSVLLLTFLLDGVGRVVADTQSQSIIGRQSALSRGSIELLSGNFAEGVRLTETGLAQAATRTERVAAFNNLCAGYTALNQPLRAITYCNASLALRERNWRAYSNRALAYLTLGRLDAARRDVTKGLEIRPGSRTLHKVADLVAKGITGGVQET